MELEREPFDAVLLVVDITTWAAQECDRQRSGELSVAWMVQGWQYALRRAGRVPSEHDIIALGGIVEPRHNNGETYRKTNVRVGLTAMPCWQEVGERMERLVSFLADHQATVDPDKWFRQYEEIHPFRDGNGRTGSILYNWIRGTLVAPVAAPDFWGAT